MPTLNEILAVPPRRARVIDATTRLIDEEMARKSGLRNMPLKAGYKVVKGIKPGFIRSAVDYLLDEFCSSLQPFYAEWAEKKPLAEREPLSAKLRREESRVADALLAVTDRKARNAKTRLVKKTYDKLRSIAKGHVVEALPGVARTVEPFIREVEEQQPA